MWKNLVRVLKKETRSHHLRLESSRQAGKQRAKQGRACEQRRRPRTEERERFETLQRITHMADLPLVIVLAVGGATVGGPEALRLLHDIAGRNPAGDVIIAVFLIFAVTALVLGTMLLARYVSVADGNDDAALDPCTARFARVTLAVALAVVVFVAACLLAVPWRERGHGGAARSCSA